MEPRYYQEEAAASVLHDWATDCPDALVVLPTGTGKTFMFTMIAGLVYKPGMRFIVLAHREELVDQPYRTFKKLFVPKHPKVKLGVVRAQKRDYDADVIFCTIQTLSQAGYKPLYEILQHGPISHVIVDETHHIVADTYVGFVERIRCHETWRKEFEQIDVDKQVLIHLEQNSIPEAREVVKRSPSAANNAELNKLKLAADKLTNSIIDRLWMKKEESFPTSIPYIKVNKDLLTLGVTATAFRADEKAVTMMFPKIMDRNRFTYFYPIKKAITDGFLAPMRNYMVKIKDEHKKHQGFFEATNWGELLTAEWFKTQYPDQFEREAGVEILEQVEGLEIKQTLCFFPDIKSSRAWIQFLGEKYGIEGAHVDGTQTLLWDNAKGEMVTAKRSDTLKKFNAGLINILSNVNVLTEGADFPNLEVGIIARATGSLSVYMQMLGRYLRLNPDDPDKVARILHVGFSGMLLRDISSAVGHIPDKKAADDFERKLEEIVGGIKEEDVLCPECGGMLKRVRGTNQYECEECWNIFDAKEVGSKIPDIFAEDGDKAKAGFAAILNLFAETKVAWYKDSNNIWSVGIGTGGSGPYLADRTILIVPPGLIPMRPNGYNVIEIRRPVTHSETVRGYGKWAKTYQKHSYGRPEGAFIGDIRETIEEAVEAAIEKIEQYQEPRLSEKSNGWRTHQASDAQIKKLAQLGVADKPAHSFTKGDAAKLISHHSALQYMRQRSIL